MKVLITGSRNWDDSVPIKEQLVKLPADTILIHGDAKGADQLAGAIGHFEFGMTIHKYPAQWSRYGKGAGPIRNQFMLDSEHRKEEPIDLVLAFHENIEGSKGTADMVQRATKAGLTVKLVSGREQ